MERLPERFKNAKTAEAIMSPGGILLAGAGASAAILAGAPLLVAGAVGAVAWAVKLAFSVPRKRKGERIDPFSLGEPWRFYVREALQAQTRYQQAVTSASPGPLRDRLASIGTRIEEGVRACWRIAQKGQALERAFGTLNVESVQRQIAEIEQHEGRTPAGSDLEQTLAALKGQLASAERIAGTARGARDRLRLLGERLDEAAARAVELSVQADEVSDLTGLGSDVDALVSEMESLRQALEETSGPPGTATATA